MDGLRKKRKTDMKRDGLSLKKSKKKRTCFMNVLRVTVPIRKINTEKFVSFERGLNFIQLLCKNDVLFELMGSPVTTERKKASLLGKK